MNKYSSNREWIFEPAALESVVVLKLTIEEITAKQKR